MLSRGARARLAGAKAPGEGEARGRCSTRKTPAQLELRPSTSLALPEAIYQASIPSLF
jgi:hypothetical protein